MTEFITNFLTYNDFTSGFVIGSLTAVSSIGIIWLGRSIYSNFTNSDTSHGDVDIEKIYYNKPLSTRILKGLNDTSGIRENRSVRFADNSLTRSERLELLNKFRVEPTATTSTLPPLVDREMELFELPSKDELQLNESTQTEEINYNDTDAIQTEPLISTAIQTEPVIYRDS